MTYNNFASSKMYPNQYKISDASVQLGPGDTIRKTILHDRNTYNNKLSI